MVEDDEFDTNSADRRKTYDDIDGETPPNKRIPLSELLPPELMEDTRSVCQLR